MYVQCRGGGEGSERVKHSRIGQNRAVMWQDMRESDLGEGGVGSARVYHI